MHETPWVVLPADMRSWLDMIYLSWSNVLCFGGCFRNFFGGQLAAGILVEIRWPNCPTLTVSSSYYFLGCVFFSKVHIRRCFPTLIQYIVICLVKGNLTSEIIIRMFPNSSFQVKLEAETIGWFFWSLQFYKHMWATLGFGKVMLSSRVQIQYMAFF